MQIKLTDIHQEMAQEPGKEKSIQELTGNISLPHLRLLEEMLLPSEMPKGLARQLQMDASNIQKEFGTDFLRYYKEAMMLVASFRKSIAMHAGNLIYADSLDSTLWWTYAPYLYRNFIGCNLTPIDSLAHLIHWAKDGNPSEQNNIASLKGLEKLNQMSREESLLPRYSLGKDPAGPSHKLTEKISSSAQLAMLLPRVLEGNALRFLVAIVKGEEFFEYVFADLESQGIPSLGHASTQKAARLFLNELDVNLPENIDHQLAELGVEPSAIRRLKQLAQGECRELIQQMLRGESPTMNLFDEVAFSPLPEEMIPSGAKIGREIGWLRSLGSSQEEIDKIYTEAKKSGISPAEEFSMPAREIEIKLIINSSKESMASFLRALMKGKEVGKDALNMLEHFMTEIIANQIPIPISDFMWKALSSKAAEYCHGHILQLLENEGELDMGDKNLAWHRLHWLKALDKSGELLSDAIREIADRGFRIEPSWIMETDFTKGIFPFSIEQPTEFMEK